MRILQIVLLLLSSALLHAQSFYTSEATFTENQDGTYLVDFRIFQVISTAERGKAAHRGSKDYRPGR